MSQDKSPWFLPMHFLCVLLAGWIHREQLQAIAYLQTECTVLRELLGRKRIRLNDEQRRRLAVKGRELSRWRLRGGTVRVAWKSHAFRQEAVGTAWRGTVTTQGESSYGNSRATSPCQKTAS